MRLDSKSFYYLQTTADMFRKYYKKKKNPHGYMQSRLHCFRIHPHMFYIKGKTVNPIIVGPGLTVLLKEGSPATVSRPQSRSTASPSSLGLPFKFNKVLMRKGQCGRLPEDWLRDKPHPQCISADLLFEIPSRKGRPVGPCGRLRPMSSRCLCFGLIWLGTEVNVKLCNIRSIS